MTRTLIYTFTSFALLLVSIIGSALWFDAQDGPLPRADAILVLGAGMDADGTLHASTLKRVEAGVALFHAGAAPMLVMTGGRLRDDAPSAGEQMAKHAAGLGVPETALIFEAASMSTLQNALLTRPLLEQAGIGRVILVTEGFHMARSLVTMRWAGIEVVGMQTSSAFRTTLKSSVWIVLREAAAWGVNLARVPIWHLGGWLGIEDDTRMAWLR